MIAVRAVALAMGFLAAPAVRAEPRVLLTYQAPAGCPAEAEFVAGVAARGGKFAGDHATAHATSLAVAVRAEGDVFVGSLHVEKSDGPSREREVRASDCGEVVQGLSMVAALALGGQEEANPESKATPAAVAAAPQAATAPPAKPEESGRLRGSRFATPDRVDVAAGSLRFDRATSYTLMAGAAFGIIPSLVLPRYDFTISVANFVVPPQQPSYLVGQVLGVHWNWLGPATRHDGDLSTDANGSQAGVYSCTALTYDNRGFTALACAEFGIGYVAMTTKSSDGAYTKDKLSGFGTAGLDLDATYGFGSRFHVGLRAGASLKVGKTSAERPDGSELFATEDVSAIGHVLAGVGLHF